ncbi:MAG: histidine ammonia-lyase [Bacteroidia bacterium]
MKITIASLEKDLENFLAQIEENKEALRTSRKRLEKNLQNEVALYGVNTGFGALARTKVPADALSLLQKNLLLSHAVGVGPPLPKPITRLILLLKLHSLSLGYSGISEETFDRLLLLALRDWIPVVPMQGSVGASGDLAPLAHLALPLIGEGALWDSEGTCPLPTQEALQQAGLAPISLQPKDGLALINGTEFMTALGAYVLEKCYRLVAAANLAAAMSVEALLASHTPFDARFYEVRAHPGGQKVAAHLRQLLAESQIALSHQQCSKVQDPYSLRCAAHVHGAAWDALAYAEKILETEIQSPTDNPLLFPDGAILSGGNFHGEPVALALDFAAIALAEIAAISERRIYLLLDGQDGLPPFLAEKQGFHSGLMIAQYTAAALVSENKILAHPASVDSIPTSKGQEDHVSMGSISATKLLRIYENTLRVLSIEIYAGYQALFYRQPLRAGKGVQAFFEKLQTHLPRHREDFYFQPLLEKVAQLIQAGELGDLRTLFHNFSDPG